MSQRITKYCGEPFESGVEAMEKSCNVHLGLLRKTVMVPRDGFDPQINNFM